MKAQRAQQHKLRQEIENENEKWLGRLLKNTWKNGETLYLSRRGLSTIDDTTVAMHLALITKESAGHKVQ